MQTIFVPSGSTASSGFTLERSALPLVLTVPSLAANGVQLQFATQSGGSYVPLMASRTSNLTTVFSASAGGIVVVDFVPSPYARLGFLSATTDGSTWQLTSSRRFE